MPSMPRDPIADLVTRRNGGDKWVKIGALWYHSTDERVGIKMLALPVCGMCWAFPTKPDDAASGKSDPFIQGDLMCKLEEGNDFKTRIGFITTSENLTDTYKTVYTLVFDAMPTRTPIWLQVKA